MADLESRIARLKLLEPHLRANILGQDHVIARVAEALVRAEMGLAPKGRPKGSFLFVGPTGTGKTELALCFTEFLFGPGHVQRFDLSEYQNQTSVEKLLGADRADPGLLGRALCGKATGTLLFDELEKAHPLVLDLFLQMLDAARVTVATGETISLDGHFLAFTSNVGSAEAMRMERSSWAGIEAATLRRIEQGLRPELVARLDEKLVFKRLLPETQREICRLLVDRELGRLRDLGHDLRVTPEVIDFLVRQGFDAEQGARPMRRAIERHLQKAVIDSLFQSGNAMGALGLSHETGKLQIMKS